MFIIKLLIQNIIKRMEFLNSLTSTQSHQASGVSSGRKKSLLIGINYTRLGQSVLNGCINDVENMKHYISKEQGYPDDASHMRVLIDDEDTPQNLLPTRANMTDGFRWLLQDARDGDHLFVHYSGHGGQVKDRDGDEDDGYDETLCPLDYPTAGQITDDELHALLVYPLPSKARLTFIADCCHSGSILDLPYVYKCKANGSIQMSMGKRALQLSKDLNTLSLKNAGFENKIKAGFSILSNIGGALKDLSESGNNKNESNESPGLKQASNKKGGNVVLITGCLDEQTSADAVINNSPSGALTYGLLKTLKTGGQSISYEELLTTTRKELQGQYSQIPQLCVGIELNLKDQFIL